MPKTAAAWPLFLASLLAGVTPAHSIQAASSIESSTDIARPPNLSLAAPDSLHLGMWVTADGRVRHELLPNGHYDEAHGHYQSAYQGCYWLKGNRIEYLDDTGFTADGEFRDGVLYHGGMVFRRQGSSS